MRAWIALWDGSTSLCRLLAAWIAGGPLPRLLALVLAAGFAVGLPVTTALAWLTVAAWLTTSVVLGYRSPSDAAKRLLDDPDEATEKDAPAAPAIGPEQLAVALHAVGSPHAHLSALATHLKITPGALREALTAASIPISGGVRMGGAVSTGVKKDHFPALPTDPGDGVVAAVVPGESNNNNAADFIQDKTNAHRWHAPEILKGVIKR
ncbi:hypothetical protein ABT160_02620 [Streptomyces sp. NPDC001941]|uniref:hypothetical protein n=1 Tax=Streptomyces sp. NPDC001941 TaxID=3154659 RepID=UPI003316C90B